MAEAEKSKPEEEKKKEAEDEKVAPVRTVSSTIKKKMSRHALSKVSLKKGTESGISMNRSISSLAFKRQSDYEKLSRGPKYQNTYRLDSKKPFKPNEVQKILEAVVLKEVTEFPYYDTTMGARIVQTIASEARTGVKQLHYDRYKICIIVCLGEQKLQGFQSAFRALWDVERDGWTTYYYQCRSYYISCTCFGLYHD